MSAVSIFLVPEEEVSGEKNIYITQPGSTVATSLTDGEAKQKHVGILEIKGKDFKIHEVKLILI